MASCLLIEAFHDHLEVGSLLRSTGASMRRFIASNCIGSGDTLDRVCARASPAVHTPASVGRSWGVVQATDKRGLGDRWLFFKPYHFIGQDRPHSRFCTYFLGNCCQVFSGHEGTGPLTF